MATVTCRMAAPFARSHAFRYGSQNKRPGFVKKINHESALVICEVTTTPLGRRCDWLNLAFNVPPHDPALQYVGRKPPALGSSRYRRRPRSDNFSFLSIQCCTNIHKRLVRCSIYLPNISLNYSSTAPVLYVNQMSKGPVQCVGSNAQLRPNGTKQTRTGGQAHRAGPIAFPAQTYASVLYLYFP